MAIRRSWATAVFAMLVMGWTISPAAAQSEPLGEVDWSLGALEVLESISGLDGTASLPPLTPVAEDGTIDASVEPLRILDASIAVFDGPGNQLQCPFFDGTAFTIGGDPSWRATEFCAGSSAFYDVSVQTVVAVAELNRDPQIFPGYAELAIGYTVAGSPVNPEVPGFDVPTSGFSHISALTNDGGGDLRALHVQATGDLSPIEYGPAHHAGILTTGDGADGERVFGFFVLENPTVPFQFIATSATTPGDLATFGTQVVGVDPRSLAAVSIDSLTGPNEAQLFPLLPAPEPALIDEPVPATEPPVQIGVEDPEPAPDPVEEPPAASPVTASPAADPDPIPAGDDAGEGGSFPIVPVGGGIAAVAIAAGVVLSRRRTSVTALPESSASSLPAGPVPPLTSAQRFKLGFATHGPVTKEMAKWALAADVALSNQFDQSVTGQWVFRQSDPYVVEAGEPIPEEALDHGPTPDGDGTMITFTTAHRKYRIGEDGNFLGLFAYDDRTAVSVLSVTFRQDDVTMGFPVTYGHVWDVDTRRLFTSVSSRAPDDVIEEIKADNGGTLYLDGDLSRPDPRWVAAEPKDLADSMAVMAERVADGGLVHERIHDDTHPLNTINRHFQRTLFVPLAPPTNSAPTPPATDPAPVVSSALEPDPEVPGSLAEQYLDHTAAIGMGFDHAGRSKMIRQAAVDEALAAGAQADPDGWLPISSGAWFAAYPTVWGPYLPADPDSFSGTLINIHTLQRITREYCEAFEDPEMWTTYRRAMENLGLDPTGGINEPAAHLYDNIELNDALMSDVSDEVIAL